MEIESFLANNVYLSGDSLPNQEDARVLESIKEAPDRSKYPNFFAWWWNLCLFQQPARALWGSKAEGKDKKKEEKKEEKKVEKKEESDDDDDDDDDVDLFGGPSEEDQKALEEEAAKNKKKKKVVIAKSQVTFDVKGYDADFDFDQLGKDIKAKVNKDGLVWQIEHKIIEIGFGIKCLRLVMIIEDAKISSDDILDEIAETWEDDVQSCDIVDFQKA